jgi:hypothetical protein
MSNGSISRGGYEMAQRIVDVVDGPWKGRRGEVVKSSRSMLRVRIDEKRCALVLPSHVVDVVEDVAEPGLDFSESGLGIGGLATYEEPPVILTEQQWRRMEKLQATEIICKRCGASSLDGAMFTTLGGSGICDDCA